MNSNKYHKLIIYYFSGTGNSRNVAMWLADEAKRMGLDVRVIDIVSGKIDSDINENSLIIFISPIHGFNYPPVMIKFLLSFPKGSCNVVLMNTRAGMLIRKFVTPGITGIAFYFASLILISKGYKLKGWYPVDLPSNWISVHPGLNKRTTDFLHTKNRERVYNFARKIFSGNSYFRAVLEFYDLLLLPIAIGYYFIGRFILAKTYYASNDCDNCGICIKGCPVGAIKEIGNKPFWTINCESCMKCMGNCPKKAIETGHGLVAVIIALYSFLIGGIASTYLNQFDNSIFGSIVNSMIFLLITVVVYRISHFLMRFRIFERINVLTSLTKYKFWGRRYKAKKWME